MMRLLQTGVSTALISAIISAPTLAATLTPTEQVQQAVDWFTGFFTNQAQVNNNPNVPLLTMENCAVPTSSTTTSQYVHLEQFFGNTGSLLRSRAYEFSPGATGVDLSIFSYRNLGTALGTCEQTTPILDLSNLLTPSCDLTLTYREDEFFGTNVPIGCPTSFPVPGSTVVSTVTIAANTVDSTDTFLLPSGGAIGTPITFNRVSTPEPTLIVGVIAVGLLATASYKRI
ncbi:CpeT/CpcT family [Leptolyngbya sp. Heron Island J]|uniref:CpcT/CpeT family chromophore lyase n=1 Tax=Leptolyngbya sp. Heron Island J TaxID=1385935 RepID=UPI0003B9F194|nr:CpcT/CpeT family chromophore lyase [Leptolyngbya sp. Heron Island J]ESA38605.1 CpeT/CpcT family [Leptolyngbya sp. Heron Island J]